MEELPSTEVLAQELGQKINKSRADRNRGICTREEASHSLLTPDGTHTINHTTIDHGCASRNHHLPPEYHQRINECIVAKGYLAQWLLSPLGRIWRLMGSPYNNSLVEIDKLQASTVAAKSNGYTTTRRSVSRRPPLTSILPAWQSMNGLGFRAEQREARGQRERPETKETRDGTKELNKRLCIINRGPPVACKRTVKHPFSP